MPGADIVVTELGQWPADSFAVERPSGGGPDEDDAQKRPTSERPLAASNPITMAARVLEDLYDEDGTENEVTDEALDTSAARQAGRPCKVRLSRLHCWR